MQENSGDKEAIPEQLKSLIDYVVEYVGDASNDWFKIKLQIINSFPPKERSRFSRRHYSTKKHQLNKFDKAVIKYWEKQTGIKLWIDPKKLHPKDYNPKPRGWRLEEINEQRRRAREQNKKTTLKKGNSCKNS